MYIITDYVWSNEDWRPGIEQREKTQPYKHPMASYAVMPKHLVWNFIKTRKRTEWIRKPVEAPAWWVSSFSKINSNILVDRPIISSQLLDQWKFICKLVNKSTEIAEKQCFIRKVIRESFLCFIWLSDTLDADKQSLIHYYLFYQVFWVMLTDPFMYFSAHNFFNNHNKAAQILLQHTRYAVYE